MLHTIILSLVITTQGWSTDTEATAAAVAISPVLIAPTPIRAVTSPTPTITSVALPPPSDTDSVASTSRVPEKWCVHERILEVLRPDTMPITNEDIFGAGEALLLRGEYNEAYNFLSHPTLSHHNEALFLLGYIELKGFLGTSNLEKAYTYFTLAAELESPRAIFYISVFYDTGIYLPQNFSLALLYAHKAAKLGSLSAVYNCAIYYLDGLGCKADSANAFRYMQYAAEKGHPDALAHMGAFYSEGTIVARNPDKAFKYANRAQKAGSKIPYMLLAYLHQYGYGTETSVFDSIYYLLKAQESGDPRAADELAPYSPKQINVIKELITKPLESSKNVSYTVEALTLC